MKREFKEPYKIKYVVVCKKGYCFAGTKKDVIDFIEKLGRDIAYYIGYYTPAMHFFNQCADIEELGEFTYGTKG